MLRRFPIAVAVVALATLTAAPGADAGKGGTNRPFKAMLVGEASFEIPSVTRHDCEPSAAFSEAAGKATHMGKITVSQSHCPADPEYIMDGRMTIIAANGDEMYGTYNYGPEVADTNAIPIMITGGSGRFEGASGWLTEVYDLEPALTAECTTEPFCFEVGDGLYLDLTAEWPWWATLTGTISY